MKPPYKSQYKLDDLPDDQIDLILQTRLYDGLATRTDEQNELVASGKEEMAEKSRLILNKSLAKELHSIRFYPDIEQMTGWEGDLSELRPPPYPNPANTSSINNAIAIIYQKLDRAYSVFEEVEPIVATWISYEKRMRNRAKAIFHTSKPIKEWEGDALFETWYPTDVSSKVRKLAEIAAMYKIAIDKLNLAWSMLSRQVTLYTEHPTEEMSRTDQSTSQTRSFNRTPVASATPTTDDEPVRSSGKSTRRFGE